jgi:hypothetical protein
LLAVVAAIDAGLHLLFDDVPDRLVHFNRQHFGVVTLALFLRDQ